MTTMNRLPSVAYPFAQASQSALSGHFGRLLRSVCGQSVAAVGLTV